MNICESPYIMGIMRLLLKHDAASRTQDIDPEAIIAYLRLRTRIADVDADHLSY